MNKNFIAAALIPFILTLTACGGGGSDDTAQTPTPEPVNQAPTITVNGASDAYYNDVVTFTWDINDPDGDAISVEYAIPAGLSSNITEIENGVSFITNISSTDINHTLLFDVTDSHGSKTSATTSIIQLKTQQFTENNLTKSGLLAYLPEGQNLSITLDGNLDELSIDNANAITINGRPIKSAVLFDQNSNSLNIAITNPLPDVTYQLDVSSLRTVDDRLIPPYSVLVNSKTIEWNEEQQIPQRRLVFSNDYKTVIGFVTSTPEKTAHYQVSYDGMNSWEELHPPTDSFFPNRYRKEDKLKTFSLNNHPSDIIFSTTLGSTSSINCDVERTSSDDKLFWFSASEKLFAEVIIDDPSICGVSIDITYIGNIENKEILKLQYKDDNNNQVQNFYTLNEDKTTTVFNASASILKNINDASNRDNDLTNFYASVDPKIAYSSDLFVTKDKGETWDTYTYVELTANSCEISNGITRYSQVNLENPSHFMLKNSAYTKDFGANWTTPADLGYRFGAFLGWHDFGYGVKMTLLAGKGYPEFDTWIFQWDDVTEQLRKILTINESDTILPCNIKYIGGRLIVQPFNTDYSLIIDSK
jgi:hypothetical protein